ncbi:NYN domain-containing protein [Mycena kentingensis (nom. inval.)]|nr:NYN domain-containing protein [Mycena kentingensis (nom. inval.)]
MIYIEKLRVRPKKAIPNAMCGAQLAAMLGCWAATSDIQNLTACKEASEQLFHCMRTTVCALSGLAGSETYTVAPAVAQEVA